MEWFEGEGCHWKQAVSQWYKRSCLATVIVNDGR